MHDNNAGNFQIHGTNAHALTPVSDKEISRILVPRKHSPRREEIDAALQPSISNNLAMRVAQPVDLRQPTKELFLHRNNRRCYFLTGRLDPLQKARSKSRRMSHHGDVICVKNQQSLFGRFAVSGSGVRVLQPLSSNRHSPVCRRCGASPFWAASPPKLARAIRRIHFPDLSRVFQAFATWR